MISIPIPRREVDLARTFTSGQTFRWRQDEAGNWIGADGPTWWTLRQTETEISGESNAPVDVLARYLRLDSGWNEFEEIIRERAPELSEFVKAQPGLRVLRPQDCVETIFGFMCSGNNSLHRIIPMTRNLGDRGKLLENGAHSFPSLDAMANVSEDELRRAGFGYRARFIVAAVEKIESLGGDAWIDRLRTLPYDAAWPELTQLPGIGRKIADCICLFGLDHGESVPVDTHIWQQLTRLYHPELTRDALTARKYELISCAFRDRLGSVAGWAHQFLFEDNVKNGRSRRAAMDANHPG